MCRALLPAQLLWVTVWVSAGVLGFEISLMRLLLVSSWHHFAFVVISIALLGFGASGTALYCLRTRLLAHPGAVLLVLAAAAAVCMPVAAGAAQLVPIESRILPALMWRQLGWWMLYWSLLGLPFFFGAATVGLCLMLAGPTVPRIYAGNLLGSAAGSLLAVGMMSAVPPVWLPAAMSAVTAAATLALLKIRTHRAAVVLPLFLAVGVWLILQPPTLRMDPYKFGAYAQRLSRQADATCKATACGPRAFLQLYEGGVFHDVPFLTGGAPAPPLAVLLADGHLSGTVLEIVDVPEARLLDETVMAFAYAQVPQNPRVLLLGETGTVNVWLALFRAARRIDIVQGDANVFALLSTALAPGGGAVLQRPDVHPITAEPRHFVTHTEQRYDLIQLVSLQSAATGGGGIGGLGQDVLITVEGIAACLSRLSPHGVLSVTRGIQDPPRDNLKILTTVIDALGELGVSEPSRHIVIVRDFLGVCTLARRAPWTPLEIARVRESIQRRHLTPVWFSGITPAELNRPDRLPSPEGQPGDWYYHAAVRLFSSGAKAYIADWRFDIRPPTDDRPFFLDFCKLSALGAFKRAYGDLWLVRVESAYIFVLASIAMIAVASFVMTLGPLVLMRGARRERGLGTTVVYFAALGLGYLLLEMTLLSRLTLWIGDPVTAAAATIAGFLLFSGVGSLCAQRLAPGRVGILRCLLAGLILVGLIELCMVHRLALRAGGFGEGLRIASALLFLAPLAFLMGFPMPVALARLQERSAALVPWAWGVNGFASVLAAPLATAIGMTAGFSAAGLAGLLLYICPAILIRRLPGALNRRRRQP